MKLLINIFLLILINDTTAQNSVFFARSDSCKLFRSERQKDSLLIMKVINRCANYSVIQEVDSLKGTYSRNGFYTEFYDTTFSRIKKNGFFLNGIETGMWKEYYSSGQLAYQGSCKIVKLIQSKSDANIILRIDKENLKDTIKINMSSPGSLDSLKKLAQYHYYPTYEMSGIMLPVYYSLKVGTWLYYSESGELLKKEIYKDGVLINSER